MIRSIVQRFGKSSTRIYVVLGEQLAAFKEPKYSTHPDAYSFPFDRSQFSPESPSVLPPNPFKLPIGTAREKGPNVIKVFSRAEDAIAFVYCCNLSSVNPRAFERIDDKWVCSKDQSAFDINW